MPPRGKDVRCEGSAGNRVETDLHGCHYGVPRLQTESSRHMTGGEGDTQY